MTSLSADRVKRHWGMDARASMIGMPETGASMFRWTRQDGDEEFHFGPVQHDHYVLSLILKPMGAMVWSGSKEVWNGSIERHGVRIVHPEDENRWATRSGFDLLHVMFPRNSVQRLFGDGDAIRFKDPLYRADEMVLQIGRQLLTVIDNQGPLVEDFADGLCHALVAYIVRRYAMDLGPSAEGRCTRQQIERVLDLVRDNLAAEITLDGMARTAGMSVFHFSREFRKNIGVSPHRYVMNCRIDRAKQLLASRRLSILEVSLECGFKDASHFARVFRSTCGETPRSYRSSV